MDEVISGADARYGEIFDPEHEAKALGTKLIDDPYPIWRELAAKGPVLHGSLPELMGFPPEYAGHFYHPGPPCYTAFSFAAVTEALINPDRFSSQFYEDGGIRAQLGHTILSMDGALHRSYRGLVQPLFQPEAAETWWSSRVVGGLVEELVAAIEAKGSADLNADFFARLPMHVVTAGFGLSPEDGLAFRHHFTAGCTPSLPVEESTREMNLAIEILLRAIRERRTAPRDDIISKVLHAELKLPDGTSRPPTDQEVVDFCRLTMGAGGGTTWRQLGITMYALLEHPDQLEAVKADRSLIRGAVLESARWCTTDPLFPRKVMRDTTLAGVPVSAGATLHLCFGAANRDPARWENPDSFDIFRPVLRSVAFAAGPHSCLGQHVARQEMLQALNAIFDRLPNLRWDPAQPAPNILGGLIGRGPGPLHVRFGR